MGVAVHLYPLWRGLFAVTAAKALRKGIRIRIYIVQKNVTRNGTLKSSTQPWKIDTTA